MKTITRAIFILSALAASFAARSENRVLSGEDCHVGMDALKCIENPYYPLVGDPCTWGAYNIGYWYPMKLASSSTITFKDSDQGLSVNVTVSGNRAHFQILAPNVNKEKTVTMKDGDAAFYADFKPANTATEGRGYKVSCSFGLVHRVNEIKKQEELEMDRLGPQGEWHDPFAPSLESLPIGTILKLKKEMPIVPGSETDASYFVEEHCRISMTEFHKLTLQWRFAYAQFFNSNNGYIRPVTYPQGMEIRIIAIEKDRRNNGGGRYVLRFQTLTPGIQDPITWMSVSGRRAGRFDIKAPQFAALISSHFEVISLK